MSSSAAWRQRLAWRRRRRRPLALPHGLGRELQGLANVLLFQIRICAEDLGLRHPFGHQAHDGRDRDA
jgi:hypothetical protein